MAILRSDVCSHCVESLWCGSCVSSFFACARLRTAGCCGPRPIATGLRFARALLLLLLDEAEAATSLRGLRFRLLSARDASDEGISFGSFVGASEVDGGAGQSDVVRALSGREQLAFGIATEGGRKAQKEAL